MKQPNLLQKINEIFDKKQKRQLVLLGFMIFIGGFLETLGVSTMIPVVTVLLTPEKVQEYIDKYDFLSKMIHKRAIFTQITNILLHKNHYRSRESSCSLALPELCSPSPTCICSPPSLNKTSCT